MPQWAKARIHNITALKRCATEKLAAAAERCGRHERRAKRNGIGEWRYF
jgi:hypothetical protein